MTWEQLVQAWKILTPGHFLRQKERETVLELLGRHRQTMRDLRRELKRIEESDQEPEEKDYVRNLLLAPVEKIRKRMTELIAERKLDKKKMPEEVTTNMMVEVEYEIANFTNYEFTDGVGENRGAGYQRQGQQQQGQGQQQYQGQQQQS